MSKRSSRKKRTRAALIAVLVVVILAAAAGFVYFKYIKPAREADNTPTHIFTTTPSTTAKPSASATQTEKPAETTEEVTEPAPPRYYAAASSCDLATAVAMSVMEAGGNAVDAAVALGYTLCVAEPYASGLGGSGGMLVYDSNTGECWMYDYRAEAGSGWYDTAGVPGFVAGMQAALDDFGTISMSDLIEPARYYAENGFEVYGALGIRLNSARDYLYGMSQFYNDQGGYLKTGDIMRQPDLAETLALLQEEGSDYFYTGAIADHIVDKSAIRSEDLANYEVIKSPAINTTFNGYTVYSANAPLSGLTLLQMLKMADMLDIANPTEDQATYLSQLNRITNAAYADRYYHVVDTRFYDVNQMDNLTTDYLKSLMENYGMSYADDEEGTETTSFSVIDSSGLVVTCTNTLTSFWGNKVMVDGFFLNSSNINFTQNNINYYEAGKRSRTFTAPTIAVGEDGYAMAIGSPGGNVIPSVLFDVITDVLKFGVDPQEAVTKARVIYRSGVLNAESDVEGGSWLDTSEVYDSMVWRSTSYWWGSVSLVGYDPDYGAYSTVDGRRGATYIGIYDETRTATKTAK